MVRTVVISDELWTVLEPVLPRVSGVPGGRGMTTGGRWKGIAWRFRTGSPRRDLPAEFGAYQSVWERHRRWSTDGTYGKLFAAVKANACAEDRELMGTISVLHQHPRPSARRGAPASTTTQGAESNDKDLPGEPADHALGRSRGGWTTKIHALTDELCAPVTPRAGACRR